MTEKAYGGVDSRGGKGAALFKVASGENTLKRRDEKGKTERVNVIDAEAIKNFKRAGEIAIDAMNFAKKLCKPETPLLEIVEKVEGKILEKAQIAFPLDLSVNEIAAHYSPLVNDVSVAGGILKIDMGVSLNGYPIDLARSVDLSDTQEFKELILASENALKNVRKMLKYGVEVREIGKTIMQTITSAGFSPIRNLSGHEIARYMIHAGITIPNYDNNNSNTLPEGFFAIEPFSTTGEGVVQDGKASGVYMLLEKKAIRDSKAREILKFIEENYNTLPFSERWIHKIYGQRGILALNMLERERCVKQFSQLVEKSRKPVSQHENTFLVLKDKVECLTE